VTLTHAKPQRPRRTLLTHEGQYWLFATLLLGAVGWWKSISLVILLAYLMAALLALNAVLARRQTRRVMATPLPLAPIYAGEEASLSYQVSNTSSRPATVTVATRIADAGMTWLIAQLPPGESVLCSRRQSVPLRGVYPLPAPHVRSGFPFGLVTHEQETGWAGLVVVLPARGGIEPAALRRWLFLKSGGDGRIRKVVRRVTADQADTRGVRPYRPGDPLRAVHWRSSARRGQLMVREYDAAPSPDLVLVVEPWLPVNPTPVQRGNLEAALSLATTLAQTWMRTLGSRVTVAVAGDPSSVRTTTANESGLREALAPLAAVTGSPHFEPLPAGILGRGLERTTRLLVSSRSATPYAAVLSRTFGRPFVAVAPSDHPHWYHPPGIAPSDPPPGATS